MFDLMNANCIFPTCSAPLSPFTVMYEQIAAANRVLGAGMRWMASGPVPAGTLLLGA
jgi:hypothetical protein